MPPAKRSPRPPATVTPVTLAIVLGERMPIGPIGPITRTDPTPDLREIVIDLAPGPTTVSSPTMLSGPSCVSTYGPGGPSRRSTVPPDCEAAIALRSEQSSGGDVQLIPPVLGSS